MSKTAGAGRARAGIALPLPQHFHVPPSKRETVIDAESEEFRRLTEGLADIETSHDFVVIDTPGSDTFLNRLAHRIADTLITPMNDSFVDFDVLARIDPVSHEIIEHSQYATAVRDARRERRQADNSILDWVVVRNRMANVASRNEQKIDSCLRSLSMQLGFRVADGISERVVFREFFPIGLTALDDFDEHVLGTRPTLSHLAARQEIRQLLAALRLPTDEFGRKRAGGAAQICRDDRPADRHAGHFRQLSAGHWRLHGLASVQIPSHLHSHERQDDPCPGWRRDNAGQAAIGCQRDRRIRQPRSRAGAVGQCRPADPGARRDDEPAADLGSRLFAAGRDVRCRRQGRRPQRPACLFPRARRIPGVGFRGAHRCAEAADDRASTAAAVTRRSARCWRMR